MRITFLGGADEVGASSILIEIGGRRLLIDAGIRPSPQTRWGLSGEALPHLASIDSLDAVLVTHAHTDHTGALELVVARFPKCPVYATPPTIALSRVLHADARRIMQTRLDEEGELPLYDEVAVEKLLSAFVPVPFRTRLPLGEKVAATFYPAGHIAGAAMIALDSTEGRVLISGDVSVSPQRTVDGLKPPAFHPDILILESTYGGRLHANRTTEERRLVERITQVTGAGGKVLIPAFALGRAQELVEILSAFRRTGDLPNIPVRVDGMVRAVCGIYSQFPEVLPLAMQERGAVFFDEFTRPVESAAQRNALVWEPDPVVIISSSGMLAGGPSLSYARALAGHPENAILLTGYQDEESPGRRLQEQAERGSPGATLKLGKDVVDVRCQLGTYSLSAHADEGQLISLVETLDPAATYLVHGDAPARASLAQALAERGRIVELAHAGQSFERSFRASPTAGARRAPARSRPSGSQPVLRTLWLESAAPGGNYFTVGELARAWWGNDAHTTEMRAALDQDGEYFELDERGLVRARTQEQIERTERRVAQMCALAAEDAAGPVGELVLLQEAQGSWRVARIASAARDHLLVEGEATPHYPEEILERFGKMAGDLDVNAVDTRAATIATTALLAPGAVRTLDDMLPGASIVERAAAALALVRAGAQRTPDGYLMPAPVLMEPNAALAFARGLFPADARLKRAGYRDAGGELVLTFDFPDTAVRRFADTLAQIERQTAWRVRVEPEANQAALAALAREVLPGDWEIVKGPSIYREEKRVALTARSGGSDLAAALDKYLEISGYTLGVTVLQPADGASRAPAPPTDRVPRGTGAPPASMPEGDGAMMEINSALDLIRRTLAGSTLYRTSVKGSEIVLAFISPQVGERYGADIAELARTTGRPLTLYKQPNQNAMVAVMLKLAAQAGWSIVKGPSIHMDRGEVRVALAAEPDAAARDQVATEFLDQTGYRLAVEATAAPAAPAAPKEESVAIPIARIRITRYQSTLALDPDRLNKATEQLRRRGELDKPIRVRRTGDGYVLLDGLYRLRAAQSLGWERIAAVVE